MTDDFRKTLLLVEDESVLAMEEKKTFEDLGYAVLVALTGLQAVALFGEVRGIDLVLMDIVLGPGMDGAEAAAEILKIRQVPVIFLSGHTDPEILDKTGLVPSYGFVIKGSEPSVLDASIKVAFRLFEANLKTREQEKLFQSFFNSDILGTAINSPDGRWLYVNDRLCRMLGYTREELLAVSWKDLTPPDELVEELPRYLNACRKKNPAPFEKRYRRKDGTFLDVSVSTSIVENPDGSIARFSTIIQDMSDRKRIEDALRKSEMKYRSLIESSSEAIFCVDGNGEYQFANALFARTFGKTPDWFIGKTFWDIYPKEQADYRYATTKRVFETGKAESIEVDVPLPDRTLYFHATANPVKDDSGKVILNLTYATDITERKIAEEKVKALLAEKELLLVEVHHRIKNNMNTIASLLSLQAGCMTDPAAISVLGDAESRVQSMMVLYDKLYRSPDYGELSAALYLPDLAREIVSNFPNGGNVVVETHVGDFCLPVGKLSPLGMIVNELITNSMKYAFDGQTGGVITVGASLADGRVTVTVGDNGKGLPASVDFGSATGFGLSLVAGLVKQLKGSIRIERDKGTRIVLEFDI